MSRYAVVCRDAAKGLIQTARIHLELGNRTKAAKLVRDARWYWRNYVWELYR